MPKPAFEIPYYHDYISAELAERLFLEARQVPEVPGLSQIGEGGGLETPAALKFLCELYNEVKADLGRVLAQRTADRKFIDQRTSACNARNLELGLKVSSPDYHTVIGLTDANGRTVIGPQTPNYCSKGGMPVAALPDFLKGPHVTLFGPPDSAKMAINAMNAYHRKLPTEPAIVESLLDAQNASAMWGADDEDSKTPLRADLVDAAVNLTACFDGTLEAADGKSKYKLAGDHLSLPIKRFPGLALPSTFLFYEKNPIPLHLYDFALHVFHNWKNPKALIFYVPKLENEEEATYIHKMISVTERGVKAIHPEYALGSIRLMIVLENPRAILRAHEIMDNLHPYFAGASLGWHDYLASTARVFKEDSGYRIPVKADPNIVIKYIKASHALLAEAVGSRGGIKVGGMYGILPAGAGESLQVTLKGFIKDVVTQMKRDLTGFWVAHPDFVRLGLALVQAWHQRVQGRPEALTVLVKELLHERHQQEILRFIDGPDIEGLNVDDPNYVRSLLVADIEKSDYIANNAPEEIRYNVFQSLQYLTDWLCGNGCVALPTEIESIPVRVMDDLATAERSRWEVWHELHHGRFSIEEFLTIVQEEMSFIRRGVVDAKKAVQVKWDARTSKWYPIAMRIMVQLMTAEKPAEFATELLMPFTVESIRSAANPWTEILKIDSGKFVLEPRVAAYLHYFEICGAVRFAKGMAENPFEDLQLAESLILNFSKAEILQAASFHGNIGETKQTLDEQAANEQRLVLEDEESVKTDLRRLGGLYLNKFGFKFLISAKGRTAAEILTDLKMRLTRTAEQEIMAGRQALWEISLKRMNENLRIRSGKIEELRKKHGVAGVSVAVNRAERTQTMCFGHTDEGKAPIMPEHKFEFASLSKTLAGAFALDYFRARNIGVDTPVNSVFAQTKSAFRLTCEINPDWVDRVTIEHLLNHGALNLHYVKGFPLNQPVPPVGELLAGRHGYEPVRVISEPGHTFHYSGGGYLVLQHLLEAHSGLSIRDLMRPYLAALGLANISFDAATCVSGHRDSGEQVRLNFPPLAAGLCGTANDMALFLRKISESFCSLTPGNPVSHDTAVEMLRGSDRGCREFMGCEMGLGVFVAEAGENKMAIHQGANDGFRALFLHCYAGPDRGKGFVVLCNGDDRAVPFVADAAREILTALDFEGIDFGRLHENFSLQGVAPEKVVNLGYKALIFDAFLPDLPEAIDHRGPLDPLAPLNLLVGAKILAVTNQKFARAENLLSPHLPVFDPELFGRQGKIMDSWETARHNPALFDLLTVELKNPAPIRFVSLSTQFHDGNQPEAVRIQALDESRSWQEILPKTVLQGHSLLQLDLGESSKRYSRLQVEIYPDGGLTRLGIFASLPAKHGFKRPDEAKSVRFTEPIAKTKKPLNIPFATDFQVEASNEHYGPARQVISPFPPISMFDGFESARSREPGQFEEVILRPRKALAIERIVLDFTYFVNNNPLFVSIHGWTGNGWEVLAEKTKVKAFAGNKREFLIHARDKFEKIKVTVFPDGGINRIKVIERGPAV